MKVLYRRIENRLDLEIALAAGKEIHWCPSQDEKFLQMPGIDNSSNWHRSCLNDSDMLFDSQIERSFEGMLRVEQAIIPDISDV